MEFNQENIIPIIHAQEYKGFSLNPTRKSFKGFYKEILDDLVRLFYEAKSTLNVPRVAHFIIENPKDEIFKHLQIYIKRWLRSRDKALGRDSSNFRYLAVQETKPRLLESHIHLCIMFDGLTTKELYKLESYLFKLTKDAKEDNAHLHPRKLNPKAEPSSKHWHDIQTEELDAFERFSYFAKVLTKPTKNGKVKYICSKPI